MLTRLWPSLMSLVGIIKFSDTRISCVVHMQQFSGICIYDDLWLPAFVEMEIIQVRSVF